MAFVGRGRELGTLRGYFDARLASLTTVGGGPGTGKSALIGAVASDYSGAHVTCPPLPDAEQRAVVSAGIDRLRKAAGLAPASGPPPDWGELVSRAVDCAAPDGPPVLLCLDDAKRLHEARSRYLNAIAHGLRRAVSQARPFHVVLIGHPQVGDSEVPEVPSPHHLTVGPLSIRAARALLPGSSALDVVRAYSVFGGVPRVLARLDASASLASNVRARLLGPEGGLADLPGEWIERATQNPTRYYAILSALSRGEASWATVHAGVSDLSTSGQVAPYLRRLEEMDMVRVRRSLDAPPGGRNRRYSVTDPFLAFWFRFVLPRRFGSIRADATTWFAEHIRPNLDHHASSILPMIARRFMQDDAMERFGANAREIGSLWGDRYEIPVAGLLTSGAAFYGHSRWEAFARDDHPIRDLDGQVRETRFGYGRQHRIRLLFTGRPAARAVEREVARREDVFLVGLESMMGID